MWHGYMTGFPGGSTFLSIKKQLSYTDEMLLTSTCLIRRRICPHFAGTTARQVVRHDKVLVGRSGYMVTQFPIYCNSHLAAQAFVSGRITGKFRGQYMT